MRNIRIVSAGGTRLLIDPWIDGNAAAPAEYRDSTRWSTPASRPSAILVTHAHGDHDGHAIGYVLRFADGRALYHTGDTWIFGDMALIERFYHPSILLFGMGGGRAGEDPRTAADAITMYFKPRVIIPMHVGTLPPPFASEADVRAAFAGDKGLRLLVPGREVAF